MLYTVVLIYFMSDYMLLPASITYLKCHNKDYAVTCALLPLQPIFSQVPKLLDQCFEVTFYEQILS